MSGAPHSCQRAPSPAFVSLTIRLDSLQASSGDSIPNVIGQRLIVQAGALCLGVTFHHDITQMTSSDMAWTITTPVHVDTK